jgi:hypothetical protein
MCLCRWLVRVRHYGIVVERCVPASLEKRGEGVVIRVIVAEAR